MRRPHDPEARRPLPADARSQGWHNEAGQAQARWKRPRDASHADAVLQRLRCHGLRDETAEA